LYFHAAFILFPGFDQSLYPFELAGGVCVGESPNVGVTIPYGEIQRFTDVLDDPFLVVFLLDLGGQFDGGHRSTHFTIGVGADRFVIHHGQGIDFTEMQVTVDK